jgi:ABC-type phosphate transport system substrate-binding protein
MSMIGNGAAGVLGALMLVGAAHGAEITGAGSTFVFPVLAKWSADYGARAGTKINYQAIGSAGGITQIRGAAVDFGITDAPMKPAELAKLGLGQFPTVIGGVVPVVHIDGVQPGQMRFTGPLLADIYLGKVKSWNDPAIAKINPGLQLPDSAISVVHRSDGSGTTFNWVNYLSKVSPEWRDKVGEGTAGSGLLASAAKAMKESLPSSRRPRIPSAMSNMPMSFRTSWPTVLFRTRPESSSSPKPRVFKARPPAPIGQTRRTFS